eukprot:757279-Hanusia_phi.AAC.8
MRARVVRVAYRDVCDDNKYQEGARVKEGLHPRGVRRFTDETWLRCEMQQDGRETTMRQMACNVCAWLEA